MSKGLIQDPVSPPDIRLAEALEMPIIYFASPVKDRNGETFGVVVARIPITKLYEITKGGVGSYEHEELVEIDLIDKTGLLLYSSHNKEGILKDNLSDWDKL